MKQQTAVEWLMQQLPTIDKYDPYYQDLLTQAKAMEKEQIIDAYEYTAVGTSHYGEQYYNETYTKDVRYYIIDCGEDIRNTILFDITDQLKKQGHYFIVNATCEPNQFDIKRVTKKQFYESNT